MMPGLLLAIAVSLAIGFLCVSLLAPAGRSGGVHLLLRVCLGAGVGHGITSCLFFVWLLVHGRVDRSYLAVEATALAALLAAILLRGRTHAAAAAPVAEAPPVGALRYAWLIAAAFWASLAVTVAFGVTSLLRDPQGSGWDAWAIYGVRARAVFLGGSHWRDAFSPLSHRDYPLLLPLSTARAWLYCGAEVRAAQAILTSVFTLGTLGVACTTLSVLRSRTQGYLGGIALMGLATFVGYTSSAYADVPVLFFFASTFALVALGHHDGGEGHRWLILAGLTAGLAAWTKNEGLLFVPCVLLAHLAVRLRRAERRTYLRELLCIGLGLLPVLAVVLYFKTQLAPPSVLAAGMGSQSGLAKLLDRHRYAFIAYTFWSRLTYYSGHGMNLGYVLLIYLACVGATLRYRTALLQLGLTLCLMLGGYFFVYLTTPYDLGFHMKWSVDRVLLQLWPGFVLLFFLAALTPEEIFATGAGTQDGARPSG